MNRVCFLTNYDGDIVAVASDEPIRYFVVNDQTSDRVFELTPGGRVFKIGVEHVQAILRDDPIGHEHDDHWLGSGHGPRKPPSRPTLRLVE